MVREASNIVELYRMLQEVAKYTHGATPDIVHIVWERILRKLHPDGRVEVELKQPINKQYAKQAIKWTISDERRRNQRRLAREVAQDGPVSHDPLERIVSVRKLHTVWRALTSEERDIMTLLFIKGINREKVAKRLGISREALRQRLRRARLRARQALELKSD